MLNANVGLSYDQATGVYNLTNDYHNFYVNSSSGLQMSNVPSEWWSHNLMCFRIKFGTAWHERCTDALPLTWVNSTDNSTYADLNGTASWTFFVGRTVTMNVNYHLDNNDSRMRMTQEVRYIGSRSIEGYLIWRVHDIKMNNDYENDYIVVYDNSLYQEYLLNDSLNLSFSSLNDTWYHLKDEDSGAWAATWWNDTSYVLTVKKNSSEYNSVVDLEKPFILTTGQSVSRTLWWEDAICSWSCSLAAPTSQVDIYEGETFNLNVTPSWSGTCSGAGSYITAQFSNGSWYDMSGSSNLSTPNPTEWFLRNGYTYRFVVTGEDAWSTLYQTRGKCYFNLQTKYSGSANVNVTDAPQMVCTALATSKTLTASENKCYYFTANNIVFDCNGYTLYGDNDNYGISTYGRNNTIIKNCKFENFTTTVHVNQSMNTSVYNHTMSGNSYSTPSFKANTYGVFVDNSRNTLIENVTQWNFTVDRGGTLSAGGWGMFIGLKQSNNTIINNTRTENNTGDYHSGGGDPQTNDFGYGIFATFSPYNVRNLTINNFTSRNQEYADIYFYQVTTAEQVVINNVRSEYSDFPISLYQPVNMHNITVISNGAGYGLQLQDYAHYSNISNLNISGSHRNGLAAYGVDYVTLENVSITNTTAPDSNYQSIRIYEGSVGWRIKNVTISDSTYAVLLWADHMLIEDMHIGSCNESMELVLSNNITIKNSVVEDASYRTLYLLASVNTYFINTTANYSNITYGGGTSNFTVQWYARVNVTTSGGSALEATINDTDSQSNTAFYGFDDLTPWFVVNDTKYSNGGNVYYSNHTITANRSSYYNNQSSWNFTNAQDWTINVTMYLESVPPVVVGVLPENVINLPTYIRLCPSLFVSRKGIILPVQVVEWIKQYWFLPS